jgi:hypothetical protein
MEKPNLLCILAGLILISPTICNAGSNDILTERSCDDILFGERLQQQTSQASGQLTFTTLANNTFYEELSCIGFNPQINLLSATINVKQAYGFGGGLCTNGSMEYVRFWVSYDSGPYEPIGYASVNTHNIASTLDCRDTVTKPLSYTLSMSFNPKHELCSLPVLPKIRATLSYNELPPVDPYWSPTWGNTIEDHVQSMAISNSPPTVYTSGVDDPSSIDVGATFPKTLETCHDVDDGLKIDLRRNDELPIQTKVWEEITCLGLDWSLSSLIATVRVKQLRGYDAQPCDNKAFEYVSFWADWNNTCKWEFLGTTKFNVHDFNDQFPSTGLAYTAIMPVDPRNFSAPCNQTKVVRVRAALSFNKAPPIPPVLARRGNIFQTHVHLQPYTDLSDPNLPHIYSIGGIGITEINTQGNGLAVAGAKLEGQYTDPWTSTPLHPAGTRECPFGGLIKITGNPLPGHSYRVMVRRYPPPNPVFEGTPVTGSIEVEDLGGSDHHPTINPGPNGWFNYRNHFNNFYDMLGYWYTNPSMDGMWEIRLEMGTQDAAHTPEYFTDWYRVQVNNKGPTKATAHIALSNTGGTICGDWTVGTDVSGTFDAKSASEFFGGYSFDLTPYGFDPHSVLLPNAAALGYPHEVVAPSDPNAVWQVATSMATPCGYVVTMWVYDRTIVNSNLYSYFHYPAQIGFCLRKA